eukprot:CAMPEP_0172030018 /NCGR_PEP_ID=MMETSP1041-20130122/18467_1 /TAXON_ID=464988 /ORGANISM="Hemiselmis andersenii, Strain CCMP439" /LENGTH=113 /DNA_ID=CAMNT_0012686273 /DNA_START=118 /DNA_END=457 /DNA_ORIENTATION=-
MTRRPRSRRVPSRKGTLGGAVVCDWPRAARLHDGRGDPRREALALAVVCVRVGNWAFLVEEEQGVEVDAARRAVPPRVCPVRRPPVAAREVGPPVAFDVAVGPLPPKLAVAAP